MIGLLHLCTKYWGRMNRPRTIGLWTPLPWYRALHINRCWPKCLNARVTSPSWFAWNFLSLGSEISLFQENPLSRANRAGWPLCWERHSRAHGLAEFWIQFRSPLTNLRSIRLISLGHRVCKKQTNKKFSVKNQYIFSDYLKNSLFLFSNTCQNNQLAWKTKRLWVEKNKIE